MITAGSALVFPFDGVGWLAQTILILAFVVIVGMCGWTVALFVRMITPPFTKLFGLPTGDVPSVV